MRIFAISLFALLSASLPALADDLGKTEIRALLEEAVKKIPARNRGEVFPQLRDALDPYDLGLFGGFSNGISSSHFVPMKSGKPALMLRMEQPDELFVCPKSFHDMQASMHKQIDALIGQEAAVGKFYDSVLRLALSETRDALKKDESVSSKIREAKLEEIFEKTLQESVTENLIPDRKEAQRLGGIARAIFKIGRAEIALRRAKCVFLLLSSVEDVKYSLDKNELEIEHNVKLQYELLEDEDDVLGEEIHEKHLHSPYSFAACSEFVDKNFKGQNSVYRYRFLVENVTRAPAECTAQLKSIGTLKLIGSKPTPTHTGEESVPKDPLFYQRAQ